jgi:hypothetical protein
MSVPKRVGQRIQTAIKQYRPILEQAKARDINEADTVQIVARMLADLFGWHPFFEVTKEYAVRSTFVDLAVKSENALVYLIEVKAIGGDLRDNHLRQAVNYAANEGIEWVILTNAIIWRAYKVLFNKPIGNELVFEIDLLQASPKDGKIQECLFVLTKEGMTKSAIAQYHEEQLALSRFNIAAMILSEPVLKVVRREIRRAFPSLNPSVEEIESIVIRDVLKREVAEGEKLNTARKAMRRATRTLRRSASPAPDVSQKPTEEITAP